MFIPPFTTRRISARFAEISLGEAIALCEIPTHLNELTTSEALRAIVKETSLPLAAWTAQERVAALAHYLAASDEYAHSNPYALPQDSQDELYRFTVDDLTLSVHQLTTPYLEAIEAAVYAGRVFSGATSALDWMIAAMAAAIRGEEDDSGDLNEIVSARAQQIKALPETRFHELLAHFQRGMTHNIHLYNLWFDERGLIALPRQDKEEDAGQPPCRFRADLLVRESTRRLWQATRAMGRSDQPDERNADW